MGGPGTIPDPDAPQWAESEPLGSIETPQGNRKPIALRSVGLCSSTGLSVVYHHLVVTSMSLPCREQFATALAMRIGTFKRGN